MYIYFLKIHLNAFKKKKNLNLKNLIHTNIFNHLRSVVTKWNNIELCSGESKGFGVRVYIILNIKMKR